MLTLTGGLHTHWAGGGAASASEPSTTLCWLLCESEYTVEPWPLSKVLSAGEDTGTFQSRHPPTSPPRHSPKSQGARTGSDATLSWSLRSSANQDLVELPSHLSRKRMSPWTTDPRTAGAGAATHLETARRPRPTPPGVWGPPTQEPQIPGGPLTPSSAGSAPVSTPAADRDLTGP